MAAFTETESRPSVFPRRLSSEQSFGRSGGLLASLPLLDDLRRAAGVSIPGNVRRKGNVDVVLFDEEAAHDELAICHLPYLMKFSHDGATFNNVGSYEGGAAVALAAQHLNVGDGSIVPEVEGLDERCNVRFTLEMHDTKGSEAVAVDRVINITDPPSARDPNGAREAQPCALIGAYRSAVTMPTSTISGLRDYPQISATASSSALDDKSLYPLFARTNPSDDATAIAMIGYLSQVLDVRHLGVIYVKDSYGIAFAQGLRRAADEGGVKIASRAVPLRCTEDTMIRTVEDLKMTGYRYFFAAILPSANYDMLMEAAYRVGIAGTGQHVWYFSDTVGTQPLRQFPAGSPLHLAYHGSGMIYAAGGLAGDLTGMPVFDAFTTAMMELKNDDDLAYLGTKWPTYDDMTAEQSAAFHASVVDGDDFLRNGGVSGPFLYDAAIALGLSACNATAAAASGEYFGGGAHFGALLGVDFHGASGGVILDPETGTRVPESARFLLTNYVADSPTKNDTVRVREVKCAVWDSGEWAEREPFVFNDGTTVVPLDLPRVNLVENHINAGLRGTGLAMCAIILLLALGLGGWTHRNSKCRVVRAAQPVFLELICAGAFIMGAAIIPLSFDGSNATVQGLNVACCFSPWPLSIGMSVMFSSLFTKTHRTNRIFKNPRFKKIIVKAADVIKPMVALLGANVLVLSIWTAVDPLRWKIKVVSRDNFGRELETNGSCESGTSWPYLGTLAAINVGSLAFALYEAYHARNISTEFAESDYIFRVMVCILMVCFIGIPIILVTDENIDANFFLSCSFIFITCCAVLLLIFVPKLKSHYKKNDGGPQSNSTRFGNLGTRGSANCEEFGIAFVHHPSEQKRLLGEKDRKIRMLQQELAMCRRVPDAVKSGQECSTQETYHVDEDKFEADS